MRVISALILVLVLTGCDLIENTSSGPKAVDTATLAPMSGREQSLMYGADGAYQQGNYAAAERDYLSAIAESKGHVEAHLSLARLYDKQHQPEKQQVILERALELQPNHPLANYMLGKLYLEHYRSAEALAAFERGLLSRPGDLDLSIGQAIANDMLGKHTAAQSIYVRLLSQNPKASLTNVRTNLAMSYLLTDEPKKAAELLKDEVKKPDAPAVTRHNLALAYGMLGKNTEAKTLLDGEVDEETRQLILARMKEYLQEKDNDANTPPLQPAIGQAASPVEDAISPPAIVPVIVEKKPVVKAKPPVVKTVKPVATTTPADAKPQ